MKIYSRFNLFYLFLSLSNTQTFKMKISLLHPSWKRPDLAFACYNDWMGKADDISEIEYILCLSEKDPTLPKYKELFANAARLVMTIIPDNGLIIQANHAASLSDGNLLISISDDFSCPASWDTVLLTALEGKSDYIVKTDDGTQPWIITLPLMDRAYYNRFKYIYYPMAFHMFCDTEMTHVADLLGKKVYVNALFPHNHYTVGGMQKDEVNAQNDSSWAQGEARYLSMIPTNFGIEFPPARLNCDEGHYRWLESKGIDTQALKNAPIYGNSFYSKDYRDSLIVSDNILPERIQLTETSEPVFAHTSIAETSNYLLSVIVPIKEGNETKGNELVLMLKELAGTKWIEVLTTKYGNDVSIGAARQNGINAARGTYCVMIDENDNIADSYFDDIFAAIEDESFDCVGYLESVTINGVTKTACHSNRFYDWCDNSDGYDYVRTIYCKDVIKTDIVKQIGFADVHFGEDHIFSKKLKESGLLKKEAFIDKILYLYSFNNS